MSRERAPFVAQAVWRDGCLHVWGWNGESVGSTSWLYQGVGAAKWGGQGGWHDSPISYGELTRIELELPTAGERTVPAVRLDPYSAAVWLSELPTNSALLSPSVRWFADITHFALELVHAERVLPKLDTDVDPPTVCWSPVMPDEYVVAVEHAASVAPPICRNGSTDSTMEILDALVDGVARALLDRAGWKADLGRKRSADVQATRAMFASLSGPDPTLRSGSDEYNGALMRLSATLQRHRRRMSGEPVVRGRIRLTIPDDPGDPWKVDPELVDEADPMRWCNAHDVWSASARAVDLAGTREQLHVIESQLRALVDAVSPDIPGLEELADVDEPVGVELDIETAGDFLDHAPLALDRLGIELIGPEHLVTSKVRVSGVATESPSDDRASSFGKDALIQWNAVIEDVELSPAELARIETAGTTLMRAGNRWVRLDTAGLRKARKLIDDRVATSSSVGAVELLGLAAEEEVDGIEVDLIAPRPDGEAYDPSWIHQLLDGLPDDGLTEQIESEEFDGELRHYQRRALSWLKFLAGVGLGGCLADDMGLGKTATTLAHLVDRPGPHLVVCPLSVVHNWEAETHRFTPSQSVWIHHGADRRLVQPSLFSMSDANVVITTYGLLQRDIEHLASIDWNTVVLDEAQMVKNPNTKAARAVRQLRAGQKLALTGTPVENRLSELWAILDAVNPGLLGSQQRFREQYAGPIERSNDQEAAARLRTLTQPFVLRRTKADKRLLPDLPDKVETIAYAKLTSEQATLYKQVVEQLLNESDQLDGMKRRGVVLAALMRLKQICNHPAQALKDGSRLEGRSGKLNRFDELFTDILDIEERVLVFTQFREMGELLVRHIAHRFEIDAPFLHGGVSRGGRETMVARFQDGSGPPILLVSLKAGGTGLNLTAASQVIHYDRWWNPAVEDQATDRAWRLGQQRTVQVHKLVCEGTIEERIGKVIDEKRAIADAVVGTGEAWLSELSTSELADLVTLDTST